MTSPYRPLWSGAGRRMLPPILAALLLALLTPLPATADRDNDGFLVATVVDENAHRLAGVEVEVTHQDQPSLRLKRVSDEHGSFVVMIPDVLYPEPYSFRLTADGFNPLLANFRFTLGQTLRYEFTLRRDRRAPVTGEEVDERTAELYNDGLRLRREGRLDAAAERLAAASRRRPDLASTHLALGDLYLEQERWADALAAGARALEVEPGDRRALAVNYTAQRRLGRSEAAAATLEQLVAAGGDEPTAIEIYNEGAQALGMGATAEARRKLALAVRLAPQLAAPHFALARLAEAESRWREAATESERALALEPAHGGALAVRYRALTALGKAEKAEQTLDALAAVDPQAAADGLHQRAAALYHGGQAAAARQLLEQILATAPEHAPSHFLLGLAAANAGDSATARRHLERFLELAPDHPDAALARQLLAGPN